MSVVSLARAEQGLKGVVGWNEESGSVDQKFSSNVEEDQEEVQSAQTKDHVGLWNGSLPLEVVQGWVLGQLSQQPVSTMRRCCYIELLLAATGKKPLPPCRAARAGGWLEQRTSVLLCATEGIRSNCLPRSWKLIVVVVMSCARCCYCLSGPRRIGECTGCVLRVESRGLYDGRARRWWEALRGELQGCSGNDAEAWQFQPGITSMLAAGGVSVDGSLKLKVPGWRLSKCQVSCTVAVYARLTSTTS